MWPGPRSFPRPGFCLPREGPDVRVRSPLSPRDPPRPVRHAALAIRGDLGGAVSHPRLCLRHGRAGERRFKGEEPGYQYSRFSNPTVSMFEQRMAAFEGAEAARATATGMAAVTVSLMGQLKAGDHLVASKALFGSCRYVVEEFLPRYGISSTLVDGIDLDQWRNAVRPNTRTFFLEIADQSGARDHRHRGGRQDRPPGGGDAGGRQRIRHSALPESARARRRLRGLFRHQAHRRPGALSRRHHSRLREIHRGQRASADPADRPVALAVQRLGAAQGTGDDAGARAAADRHGGDGRGRAVSSTPRSRA